MRTRNKAFLSCALVAGVIAAAPGAMAEDPQPQQSCTTSNGWTVVATGPTAEACPGDPDATCTAITYTVANISLTTADHVATLVRVEAAPSALEPPASQFAAACSGDTVTGFGKYSCHERSVRLNSGGTKNDQFRLVVAGNRAPIATSVLVKKGKTTGSCPIVGLGFEGLNPFKAIQKVETVKFKGCTVNFNYDALTGAFLNAELADDSTHCAFYETTVDKLSLTLDLPGVGALGLSKFGEGYISSGSNSCTTRVIGGRVYTWGDPCPD